MSKSGKNRKKILAVFGTRPEAIKMAPVIKSLKARGNLDTRVCVTGQHRQMLDQALEVFGIKPDYDLGIMKDRQDLFDITSTVLSGFKKLLMELTPDIVLVHGDTSTAFTATLSCFYMQIPVAHVEAGLRTNNIYSPFPEEFNRRAVGMMASLHFAPTETAKRNLIAEGNDENTIYVTGNTVVDAMKMTVQKDYRHELLDWAKGSRLLLITAHRRENLGEPMCNMFTAIRRVLDSFPDVKAIYPIHMNPRVCQTALEYFSDCKNIRLTQPLDVFDFHNLMKRSFFILTDSGGIQEEASSLGKPVLVMRDTTERPEGLATGTLRLVGTDGQAIFDACSELLTDRAAYAKMSRANNPYGDGRAAERIADVLEWVLSEKKGQYHIKQHHDKKA